MQGISERGGLLNRKAAQTQLFPLWFAQGEFEIKTKFWGKSIELILLGCESLKLHGHDEEYRWVWTVWRVCMWEW